MKNTTTEKSLKKINYFSEVQINISAVLGGPIPPGIMFYKNFRALNRPKDALFSALVTFVFTLLLIFVLIKLPDGVVDRIPSFVFTAFYAIITAVLYHFFLKKEMKELSDEESARASNWTVAGYTVLGFVLFMLVTFLIVISEPPFEGESVQIGETDNEVYYQGYVTEENIQLLTYTLQDLGYFSAETSNAVQIKHRENKFTVTIPTGKSFWDNPEINSAVMILKSELSLNYESEVTIILEDYDFMGKRITKEY